MPVRCRDLPVGAVYSMDLSRAEEPRPSEEARLLYFPRLPDGATHDGKPALNRFSGVMTRGHDFPGAQVCSKALLPGRRY